MSNTAKTVLAFALGAAIFALGALLGVRWAYDDSRRWIVRGEDLQY